MTKISIKNGPYSSSFRNGFNFQLIRCHYSLNNSFLRKNIHSNNCKISLNALFFNLLAISPWRKKSSPLISILIFMKQPIMFIHKHIGCSILSKSVNLQFKILRRVFFLGSWWINLRIPAEMSISAPVNSWMN